ncbi:hypothetical protein [Xylophilus sp. GOD-11R]|uniref:hypothetical protein n=1 Tax=Xylophilus sp. GOD-11R TaxID=3089814 RepID=UPI00298CF836|nr:hypothetical protein [Xylophilus sp. GOD-11R]WPB57676.1 hypothetical protein R9X41_03210 [Xylophilus sp. GOD-11R]
MKDVLIPRTGRPRGLLASMLTPQAKRAYAVTHAQGLTLVPLEGDPATAAVIRTEDYERLTGRCAGSPQLTRTRWFMEDGEVRALSRAEASAMHDFSYSVAALVMGASDGQTMRLSDPRFLTPESILVY